MIFTSSFSLWGNSTVTTDLMILRILIATIPTPKSTIRLPLVFWTSITVKTKPIEHRITPKQHKKTHRLTRMPGYSHLKRPIRKLSFYFQIIFKFLLTNLKDPKHTSPRDEYFNE